MKNKNNIKRGVIRIDKNLKSYKFDGKKWVRVSKRFPGLLKAVELFELHKNFNELIDKKNPRFLKGQLSFDKKPQGARINILPTGKKLDGAFSLFSSGLSINDDKSNIHWDVVYLNPSGKLAYHYSLDKKKMAINKKYKHVKEFEKKFSLLKKKVYDSLSDKKDYMALPMFTLLETHMRIGNEIYFKLHKHKGLTTLQKSDIKISRNHVCFDFLGKDGVPQKIIKEFPDIYIDKLKIIINKIREDDFVFKTTRGRLLNENDFKKKFKDYIGGDFYPHIVRSYFATNEAECFLRSNKNPEKQEVKDFLIKVADELGHKKISKKTGQWEDSYAVTIGHYIDPKLAEKLRCLLKK